MKDIFCANCQKVTSHKGEVDVNGEFLFTCSTKDCGRTLKFPSDTDSKQFEKLLEKQEESNVGQVDLKVQKAKLKELLGEE